MERIGVIPRACMKKKKDDRGVAGENEEKRADSLTDNR